MWMTNPFLGWLHIDQRLYKLIIILFYQSFTVVHYNAYIFSSPEPKAQVSYCHSAPSVVRPSSVNFHIFDFSSETAERNSKKLHRKQDLNALYQVCVFRVDRKNKMAALASDWLRHFRLLLWNRWTEFNKTWQEARSQRPLPSLCFFGPIGKTRWPPWPLIGWDIFDFSSETAERNSTKLDRKQDLNALYKVCVFRADRKNKMAALASDWLRHFRLLLWNRWTEFNETWQEARSQRLLPSLCFSGRSEKQDGRPGLWLAETFSTSPLKPLNRIQRNLIGSKISKPSSKFVFFGPIGKKQDGRPGLWLAETFSTSLWKPLNGMQLNLTGSKFSTPSTKFVFFGPIGKTRWPPCLWLAETFSTSPLKPLNRIQRNLTGSKILTSSTKFVFLGPKSEQKLPPWPIHQRRWHISKTSSAQKVIATNRMHSSDLETCRMKCCCFWFHSEVKFLKRWLYSGERQWPFGPLVFYFRLFGTTGYCSACSKMIPAFEMVMRAKSNVYHLECFACQQCNHRYKLKRWNLFNHIFPFAISLLNSSLSLLIQIL